MIWFECKKCRKQHGKADNLVGTLVFCECGQGNRVPWSSTIPEPPPELPKESQRKPRSWQDEDNGGPRWSQSRDPETEDQDQPARPRDPGDLPLRRKQVRLRRIRPGFCFHHEEDASETTCAECRIPFCSRCVVPLQGRTLCGPCKNFLIAAMGRPSRIPALAPIALLVGLVSGPVSLVLTFLALGQHIGAGNTAGAVLLCLLSLSVSVTGLVLGGKALRRIERLPHTRGVSLGLCAATTSAVSALWSLTLAGMLILQAL
jgi:hypothetical protein